MAIAKNISSSNGAVSLPSLLIITTVLLSAMENPGAEAYYTQQFYLPMGYFRNHLFERYTRTSENHWKSKNFL